MDKDALVKKIEEMGLSLSEFCAKVGFNRSSFYRKINGESEFTRIEIEKTMEVLQLKSPVPIFFK